MYDLIVHILTPAPKPVPLPTLRSAVQTLYWATDAAIEEALAYLVADKKVVIEDGCITLLSEVEMENYYRKVPVKAIQATPEVLARGIAGVSIARQANHFRIEDDASFFAGDWIIREKTKVFPVSTVEFHANYVKAS